MSDTPKRQTRYGVVDMGSNAIRVEIVEMDGKGGWTVLENHREPVRLGRDVFLTGSIPETAQAAALEVFQRFAETCRSYHVDHVRAIATSATREAQNGDLFVERIERATGVSIEVISGAQEAFLLKGAVDTVMDLDRGRSLLVDVGGGSVEVVLVDEGQIISADSYQVGALRLLSALTSNPVADSAHAAELMTQYLGNLDRRLRDRFGEAPIDRYVATGGNIDSLADQMDRRDAQVEAPDARRRVRAYPLAALQDEVRDLSVLSYAQRMEERGLRADRADTIVPAGVVYARLGRIAGAETVCVPGVGLRDGLLREIAQGHLYTFHAKDHAETVLAACRAVGERFRFDRAHGETVLRLATELFDQLETVTGLGAEERVLLQAAALLHDVGVLVGTPRHHKHSYYLIRESDLVGLSGKEKEIVALVARYHRKAHPRGHHEPFQALGRTDRLRVQKLASILRVADALDRGHGDHIRGLTTTLDPKSVRITLQTEPGYDDSLERWAVERKGRLFQDVLGLSIRIETASK